MNNPLLQGLSLAGLFWTIYGLGWGYLKVKEIKGGEDNPQS
jgi:hypothetical protein